MAAALSGGAVIAQWSTTTSHPITPPDVPHPAGTIIATPERISELTKTLLARTRGSIKEISDINLEARVLSFNAQIEASRGGGKRPRLLHRGAGDGDVFRTYPKGGDKAAG